MFDARLRRLIDPPLDRMGATLAARGIGANAMTIGGFAVGMMAVVAVVWEAFALALVLLALNRLADGLDGAIARHTRRTELGGFLDISLDFVFYGLFPLAFAIAAPAENALAAATLIASFYLNGSIFLAFSAVAARSGWQTARQGLKSIYFLSGLAEGTETIAAFALMCVFPDAFALIAFTFAAVCFLSAAARLVAAAGAIQNAAPPER